MTMPLRDAPCDARHQPRPDVPSDDIDLITYARSIWRYRAVLCAAALIAAIVTYAVNRRMAPIYEVTLRLIAFEPPLDTDRPIATSGRPDSPVRADLLARVDGNRRVAQYRAIAQSPARAAAVIDEFGLAAPPYSLTPEQFVHDHLVVTGIQASGVITVALRFDDPELLSRMAARYAAHVLETARKLNTESADYRIGRSLPLQLLDPPRPPGRPVAPRPLRNATAAALIALVLTTIAVLVLDAARTRSAAGTGQAV